MTNWDSYLPDLLGKPLHTVRIPVSGEIDRGELKYKTSTVVLDVMRAYSVFVRRVCNKCIRFACIAYLGRS